MLPLYHNKVVLFSCLHFLFLTVCRVWFGFIQTLYSQKDPPIRINQSIGKTSLVLPKKRNAAYHFERFASGFVKFSNGFERFVKGFFSIFNAGFSKFLIELFCENPVVSVLLSVMFCAKIGIRFRKKPRRKKPVATIKGFFNNNLTTLSYNRIA